MYRRMKRLLLPVASIVSMLGAIACAPAPQDSPATSGCPRETPPLVSFPHTMPTAAEGEVRTFSQPENPSVRYQWTFGDGVVHEGATVTHTFSTPGALQASVSAAYRSCIGVSPLAGVPGMDGVPARSSGSTAFVDVIPTAATLAALEAQIVAGINAERSDAGRPALVADPALAAEARAWSQMQLAVAVDGGAVAGDPALPVGQAENVTRWTARAATGLTGFSAILQTFDDLWSSLWVLNRGCMATEGSSANPLSENVANWRRADVTTAGIGIALYDPPTPGIWIVVTERFAS